MARGHVADAAKMPCVMHDPGQSHQEIEATLAKKSA